MAPFSWGCSWPFIQLFGWINCPCLGAHCGPAATCAPNTMRTRGERPFVPVCTMQYGADKDDDACCFEGIFLVRLFLVCPCHPAEGRRGGQGTSNRERIQEKKTLGAAISTLRFLAGEGKKERRMRERKKGSFARAPSRPSPCCLFLSFFFSRTSPQPLASFFSLPSSFSLCSVPEALFHNQPRSSFSSCPSSFRSLFPLPFVPPSSLQPHFSVVPTDHRADQLSPLLTIPDSPHLLILHGIVL